MAGDHASFAIAYGVPLTQADWYEDILRLEYRHIL